MSSVIVAFVRALFVFKVFSFEEILKKKQQKNELQIYVTDEKQYVIKRYRKSSFLK